MEETIVNTYSEKVQELRKLKVVVQPIYREGAWVSPQHDSFFMNEGSKWGIVVPSLEDAMGVLVDPIPEFTPNDKKILAYELGLEEKLLNVNMKKSYWHNRSVFLTRNGLHMNLENTMDLIKYVILRSDKASIAPSWKDRFELGTYKFALVSEGETLVDNLSSMEKKKKAYVLFSRMETSVDKLRDFLYVYFLTKKTAKMPPPTASTDQLKVEIGRIIEDDLDVFLDILNDNNYTLKLLIQRSVSIGALKREGHTYWLPGADHPIGVLDEVIEFLNDEKHQDVRVKLSHQVIGTDRT